jgi:hypothetical protein
MGAPSPLGPVHQETGTVLNRHCALIGQALIVILKFGHEGVKMRVRRSLNADLSTAWNMPAVRTAEGSWFARVGKHSSQW